MIAAKIGVTIATPLRSFTGAESIPPALRKLLHGLSKLTDLPYTFSFTAITGSVCRGRNKLVAEFLASGDVWLLFHDDDIEATPADVMQLISCALPIVGGLYCFREPGAPRYVLNPFVESAPDAETGLMRVAELGTGFKLYHRKVFTEAIRLFPYLAYNDPDGSGIHYGFFQQREENGRWYSEDYWFDKICRQMNVPIVAYTKTRVVHIGADGTRYPRHEWPALPEPKKANPSPNAGKLIVVLSVSRRDVDLALRWLERAKQTPPAPIMVVCSSSVDPEDAADLKLHDVEFVVCDEKTDGSYPRAANHQFLEALKYCEKAHPSQPILYCEPDTFLMRATWYDEISAEYAGCGKPFLGHAVDGHMVPHIAGCAVYPHNWRELAPSLAFLDAMPWKEAWDTACAHEIYPQAARAKTIFQLWRPAPFTSETLSLIPDSCALFHQAKGGELYDLVPLHPKTKMKVFTYFNEIACLHDPEMLELWKASWAKHGWEPIILTEADAIKANPEMFARYKVSALMKSHPGNPVDYTFACIARWIAMTVVDEPCMHVDWDVMCRSWTPADVAGLSTFPPTFFAGCTCPCSAYADGRGWRMMAAALEMVPHTPAFKPEELAKDSCDQYAFSVMPKEWSAIHPDRPCRDYNRGEGWNESPMAHFPNACTPYPRSATIKRMGFEL